MTELAARETTEVSTVTDQNQGLLSVIERVCSNPEADVNKLEKMLDMQERILDRQAEQAFQGAMAEMQADLPVIEKNGEIKVNGQVRSRYAKFEDINRAIMPLLKRHGFSLTFETNQGKGFVSVIGVLRHREGHKESTMLSIPLDISGSKNDVQAVGSSVSYGKRYVMSALLNITTTDDDDDGQAAVPAIDLFAHNQAVQRNFDTIVEVKRLLANGEAKAGYDLMLTDISDEDKHALWVAPTKGGIFTTAERDKLKEPSKYEGKV